MNQPLGSPDQTLSAGQAGGIHQLASADKPEQRGSKDSQQHEQQYFHHGSLREMTSYPSIGWSIENIEQKIDTDCCPTLFSSLDNLTIGWGQ